MKHQESKSPGPLDSGHRQTQDRVAGLRSPIEFPQSDVVIYDGNCLFCAGQVENLARLDGKKRLTFISLHDPFVAENFPDLSHDEMMDQLYLVPGSPNGYTSARYGGAAAIRFLSCRLPSLWVLAPLMHLPFTLPIWQWCYRQVAKRRYRIAGKKGEACDEDGACELHFKKRQGT